MLKRSRNKRWIWRGTFFCIIGMAAGFTLWRLHSKVIVKEENEIKTFAAFIAVQGNEATFDNRIMQKIGEKTGARAKMTFLDGLTAEEQIGLMTASGEYPDFLDGSVATGQLLEAGAYIPLDEYMEDYPNIKNYLTEQQWNQLRQADGHIYYIPQFGVVRGEDMSPNHSEEAFWIQKRVLEWAGYPKLKTLDEYFQLINDYLAANPVDADGQKNTGFQILCDGWKYFCLENPPQFLAGYPNDGCAIVDSETLEVKVYDTIPEAKQYYRKLCEQFSKGVIEAETFSMSYEQYMEKLTSGNVLGLVDQHWNFMGAENTLAGLGLHDRTYVPLGIVAEDSITDAYRSLGGLNVGNGLGITVSCEDVEGALSFLNHLLDPEIMKLRYWGEEDIDYTVGEDGIYYRTEEQRRNAADLEYINRNLCRYDWLPHYEGMMPDGKNAVSPGTQPGEYYATLSDYDKNFLDAYGFEKWTDFLTLVEENAPWYPLYTAINNWKEDSPHGIAKKKMEEVKRKWLPHIIMSPVSDFEKEWEAYIEAYHREVDVTAYEGELEREVARRIAAAEYGVASEK